MRTRAVLTLVSAALTVVMSAAVCAAAVVAHAPPPVVPLVILVTIGCPVFALWEVPGTLAAMRAEREGGEALSRLRRSLAQLPETKHPLGL